MGRYVFRLLAAVLIMVLFSSVVMSAERSRAFNIGVIHDGKSESSMYILELVKTELSGLIKTAGKFNFPAEKTIYCGWDAGNISSSIDTLFKDPDVDLIFCTGVAGSHMISRKVSYRKPVLAAAVIEKSIQGIPHDSGKSGVHNLSYVNIGSNLRNHISVFRDMAKFNSLGIFYNPLISHVIPEIGTEIQQYCQGIGIQVEFIPVSQDPERAALQLKKNGTEAVMFTPLDHLSEADFIRLVESVNRLGIPSFSMLGEYEVKKGVFAGMSAEKDDQKYARRIALNIQRIMEGEDPSGFTVSFSHIERLYINMKTAGSIHVYPSWDIMTTAVLHGRPEEGREKRITFFEAVREAVTSNLELLAKRIETKALSLDESIALSRLRPSVSLYTQGMKIDKDRAAVLGSPENSAELGIQLGQVIYSEGLNADLGIQKLSTRLRGQELRQKTLDTIMNAAEAYLNILKAKTYSKIKMQDLNLTRSNLEVARYKLQIGGAAHADVFRWEARMASSQQEYIQSEQQRNISEINLNRILNRSQKEKIQTVEEGIIGQIFFVDLKLMDNYLNNPLVFGVFSDFMVEEALKQSPEIRQLEQAVKIQKRILLSSERSFYSPDVALFGNYSTVFEKSGVASEGSTIGPPFDQLFPSQNDTNWSIGLKLEYPVFEGGKKKSVHRKAREELHKVETQLALMKQDIEFQMRTALENSSATMTCIELSEKRAEAAAKTLELIRNAYCQGAAGIIDLLEAQNTSVVSQEATAAAVYEFLIDFIRLTRAVGNYDLLLDRSELEKWYSRIDQYYKKRGFKTYLLNENGKKRMVLKR